MLHKEDRYKLQNHDNIKHLEDLGFSESPKEVKLFFGESTTTSYNGDHYIRVYNESNTPLRSWDQKSIYSYINDTTDYPIETLRVNYRHYSDNPHTAKESSYVLKYAVSSELSDLIRAITYESTLRVEGAEAHSESLRIKTVNLKAEIKDLTDSYVKIAEKNSNLENRMCYNYEQLAEASFITRFLRLFSPIYKQKGVD